MTTFFVFNLPCRVSDSLLWKAFQPHGIVKDAYVARKTDARGNWFGFVRYVGVNNLNEVLKNMNTVTIFEAKVGVSVAKYDKQNSKLGQPGGQDWTGHAGPRVTKQTATKHVPVNILNGLSFRNVVTGEVGSSGSASKVVIINDKAGTYPDHCIMRSVIGEAKNIEALSKIKGMLKNGGYEEIPVCYIGGLKVLMVLRDKRTALDFINSK